MQEIKTFNICMVSDFFYPRLGGIETHIYQLSQALIFRGFKVVVVTHFHGKRQGIRYMANGLKVYYLPTFPFVGPVIFPCVFTVAPLFRQILLRENIQIVHVHTTTSVLSSQCLFHAKTFDRKVVYTEHSLFGFDGASAIQVNGAQRNILAEADHIICVSYACKENMLARHPHLDPYSVSAISNAVDSSQFGVDLSMRPDPPRLNIVVINRLAFRKGVDLLIQIIPKICQKYKNIKFIIGGDGAMRIDLEEMRDLFELASQVTLLGAVQNHDVPSVLKMGHIFLNCSLSEAFCIAILEAASSGLLVVSTNVGGVPEVLPPELCILAEPNVDKMLGALDQAIAICSNMDSIKSHKKISDSYSWNLVASKTQIIYNHVMKKPNLGTMDRIINALKYSFLFGKFYAFLILLDHAWKSFWDLIHPEVEIDISPEFDLYRYYKDIRPQTTS